MEVMTSFQFTQPTHVPSFLVVLLSVNTVILIALHSFAFIIGTCLLPNLEAVTEDENSLHRAGFHVLNTKEGVQWRIFHHGYADLEVTTKTSIFLAVFGMGIVSSYQINYPTQVPSWLVAVMLSNSVFLISLHSFAFVIGTWLLPNLEAVSEEYVPPQEGQLKIKPVPSFSPHESTISLLG
ncbi:Hypothetical predicted protein [Cloeon dipterum]|uniref:Uncharacterized protein n=1 Tax=Cloeon dipterum TaxID=197152 RepID=A0A8S1CDM4_9INSE|nr:Hypothetical predicted protein [Cloeon dipterum]